MEIDFADIKLISNIAIDLICQTNKTNNYSNTNGTIK